MTSQDHTTLYWKNFEAITNVPRCYLAGSDDAYQIQRYLLVQDTSGGYYFYSTHSTLEALCVYAEADYADWQPAAAYDLELAKSLDIEASIVVTVS